MSDDAAKTRYPGYDVLHKRDTPSWDDVTRAVIAERLSVPRSPRFFDSVEWTAVTALVQRVVVQPSEREAVPIAAMLDAKLFHGEGDGYRDARLLPMGDMWKVGLAALNAESMAAHDKLFAELNGKQQHALVKKMQKGELDGPSWMGVSSSLFFSERVLHDFYGAYYSHPTSWSEIGFGGPANPRGYVRLSRNARDAWEPVEAHGDDEAVREINRDVR